MNKLKALLIAGLLSLSSVSFASSLSLGDYAGDSITTLGTITLDNTTDIVDNVNGSFSFVGETNVWLLNTLIDATVISFGDITYGNVDPALTYKLFSDDTLSTQIGITGTNSLVVASLAAGTYYLELTNLTSPGGSYNVHVSAVPVPAAGILFASALFGAGVFGRRKKKSAKISMVGAFTRAS